MAKGRRRFSIIFWGYLEASKGCPRIQKQRMEQYLNLFNLRIETPSAWKNYYLKPLEDLPEWAQIIYLEGILEQKSNTTS